MKGPNAQTNFGSGTGKVKVRYHNGTSAVTGYIVKLLGSNLLRVTSDGVTNYDVALAQTTGAATSLTAGFCTVQVFPFGGGTEHIMKWESLICYTTEGNVYAWRLTGAAQNSEANVEVN